MPPPAPKTIFSVAVAPLPIPAPKPTPAPVPAAMVKFYHNSLAAERGLMSTLYKELEIRAGGKFVLPKSSLLNEKSEMDIFYEQIGRAHV